LAVNGYKTRQRDQILRYFTEHRREHITAEALAEALRARNMRVGKSTIYRYLDILVQSGRLQRYVPDESAGACYQYVEDPGACAGHFHLRCTDCGEILHIENGLLPSVSQEIQSQYGFAVDPRKTVLYGRCATCRAVP
jgi:Fur family ferric uptake transcriptional regulator